ncbi:MAG: response regulator transcription factor [Polyangiaceae bacterium]|nr:response regulator transcription factor [Polyangiaceae bacterium]
MNDRARILVVEDDPSILLGLRMNLEREGYEVHGAEDGSHGLELACSGGWDLVILDIMLPGLNGYEILSSLRGQSIKTPVLVLSARTAEVDKVMGLDLGAEDYITKPFSVGELLARVRVALRRHRTEPPTWRFGDVDVDPSTRVVRRGGAVVELTATEFKVLAALVRAGGRILTREQIFEAVWGARHHGTQRTIDNFVAQLRAKLDDTDAPHHILTVRGVGYRLAP